MIRCLNIFTGKEDKNTDYEIICFEGFWKPTANTLQY